MENNEYKFANIDDAIDDFKSGKMLIVLDHEKRENEGDIVFSTKFASEEIVNFCITHAKGLLCAAISEEIADKIGIRKSFGLNKGDKFGTNFYESIDCSSSLGITTGISADERAITLSQLAKSDFKSNDFISPGHVFPVIAKKFGLMARQGHTEAAIDLAKLAKLPQAAGICEIIGKDGKMLRRGELLKFAQKFGIKMISTRQIADKIACFEQFVIYISSAKLPTKFGEFNIHIYQNLINGIEHIVLEKISQNKDIKPLLRVHSECATGDIFKSLRCDCNFQLDDAMEKIQAHEGSGFIVYLRGHEGRGIGLGNKIKCYNLIDNDEKIDTYKANSILGFEDDLRSYYDLYWILKAHGIDNFDLMTGNPEKIEFLQNFGFNFTSSGHYTKPNKHNEKYLKSKILSKNHNIFLDYDSNN